MVLGCCTLFGAQGIFYFDDGVLSLLSELVWEFPFLFRFRFCLGSWLSSRSDAPQSQSGASSSVVGSACCSFLGVRLDLDLGLSVTDSYLFASPYSVAGLGFRVTDSCPLDFSSSEVVSVCRFLLDPGFLSTLGFSVIADLDFFPEPRFPSESSSP